MPAITRATKKQRQGHARWRCGACLFELPDHVRLISGDTPFDAIRLPALESGKEPQLINEALIALSAQRGCACCRLTRDWSQVGDESVLLWRGGSIHSWAVGCKSGFQFFIPDEGGLKYPFSFHPFVDHGGFPSGDTGSTEALRKALAWMRKCCDEHQACDQSFKAPQMPKRILFIKDMDLVDIQLLEDADMLPSEPYVCLSHRWIPETLFARLTKERSQTFQQGIPKELLYPLLVDALRATFFLGFKYIWIDCLCIYQDDLEDWHHQAAVMSTIYEQAALTISALSCDEKASARRLFIQQEPQQAMTFKTVEDRPVFLRQQNHESHPFSIDVLFMKELKIHSPAYPLTTRGWVFQERLLSRRILHFTERELIWECKEALSCERRYLEALWKQIKSQRRNFAEWEWTDIITQYTATNLSKASDRLPAISGIAKRYGESHGWTYMAGLWKEDLFNLLVWEVGGTPTRRPIPQKVPSWSWASVDSPVNFPRLTRSRYLIEILSPDISVGLNPFGNPKSAKLVVKGPCLPAVLRYDDPSRIVSVALELQHTELRFRVDYTIMEPGPGYLPTGTELMYLVIRLEDLRELGDMIEVFKKYGEIARGLVLLCVEPQLGIYERIGFAGTLRSGDVNTVSILKEN